MIARNLQLSLSIALLAFVSQADWPCFRGPNHIGIADLAYEPLPAVKALWKANVGEGRWGGVIVANGKVYVNGGQSKEQAGLWCLDAETGKTLWHTKMEPTHSTPTAHKGRVYYLGDDRVLHCVDGRSGEIVWKQGPLPKSLGPRFWGHVGSPRVWKDLVIVNVGYGTALSQETGEVVWHAAGKSGLATPVIFSHRGKTAVAIFGGMRWWLARLQAGRSYGESRGKQMKKSTPAIRPLSATILRFTSPASMDLGARSSMSAVQRPRSCGVTAPASSSPVRCM